jgi:hypothetical protein
MCRKLSWAALLALPVFALSLLGSGCNPSSPTEAAGEAKAIPTGDGSPAPTTENVGQPGFCGQEPKADSPKADCCVKPDPKAAPVRADCCEKPKADAKPGDPERQIVFKVEGLTCPAVKGIGCGHRIAPVLERLDKIDGVEASAANYTGTMLRITAKAGADREKVAEVVQKDLTADKRTPTRTTGDGLTKALKDEEWRGIDRIGQLSATEFRKLNLDRVKAFTDEEKLNKDGADKLLKLAEEEWDRLAKGVDAKEGGKPPHKADWKGRCGEFTKVLVEKSKGLLTEDQRDRLEKGLTSRFEKLLPAEKK